MILINNLYKNRVCGDVVLSTFSVDNSLGKCLTSWGKRVTTGPY